MKKFPWDLSAGFYGCKGREYGEIDKNCEEENHEKMEKNLTEWDKDKMNKT